MSKQGILAIVLLSQSAKDFFRFLSLIYRGLLGNCTFSTSHFCVLITALHLHKLSKVITSHHIRRQSVSHSFTVSLINDCLSNIWYLTFIHIIITFKLYNNNTNLIWNCNFNSYPHLRILSRIYWKKIWNNLPLLKFLIIFSFSL